MLAKYTSSRTTALAAASLALMAYVGPTYGATSAKTRSSVRYWDSARAAAIYNAQRQEREEQERFPLPNFDWPAPTLQPWPCNTAPEFCSGYHGGNGP
jgi:hypothetical protein